MKCLGLSCSAWKYCPLRHSPIEALAVGSRLYECEELVALYVKFVEIGLIKKEENNK